MALESSRVIFMKKPGKSNYAFSSSYRPITLSSHVGKLFERMINRRLRTFFTSGKIIEEEQEGFRKKRSTVRSLYRMQIELEDIRRNKKPAVLLNIDLDEAFDSVWIDGFLYKLQNIGITGNLLSIIQAFLSNKLSCIKIGSYHSNSFPIHIGSPQGSVLSPTLFILFINDFIDEYPIRFKFADDTALILTADDFPQLANRTQAAADNIKRWCDKRRMAVNGSKTEIVLFNYNSKGPFEITLNSDNCKVKTSTKSLGIIIDNKTNFKEHAELIVVISVIGLPLPANAQIVGVYLSRPKFISIGQLLCRKSCLVHRFGTTKIPTNSDAFSIMLRKIFKHGPSPSIEACVALTGVPPIDTYC